MCFVFSHFFVRALNCSHYSNFGNKCPKHGTETPEDMVLTNLGDNLDSDPSGFVLLNRPPIGNIIARNILINKNFHAKECSGAIVYFIKADS